MFAEFYFFFKTSKRKKNIWILQSCELDSSKYFHFHHSCKYSIFFFFHCKNNFISFYYYFFCYVFFLGLLIVQNQAAMFLLLLQFEFGWGERMTKSFGWILKTQWNFQFFFEIEIFIKKYLHFRWSNFFVESINFNFNQSFQHSNLYLSFPGICLRVINCSCNVSSYFYYWHEKILSITNNT